MTIESFLATILVALIPSTFSVYINWKKTENEVKNIKREYEKSYLLKLVESRFEVYPRALKGLSKLLNYESYIDDGHNLMVGDLESDADIVNLWYMTVGSTYMSDESISAYQQFSFEIDLLRAGGEGLLTPKDAKLVTTTAKKLFDHLRNDLKPNKI
ncbi:hypothetical protein [Gracilimonas sp.]|uniref:hypothetical protein n=1 Tax=Gracilimonas sp. TaxID=1974203 RepID=UPI0032EFE265